MRAPSFAVLSTFLAVLGALPVHGMPGERRTYDITASESIATCATSKVTVRLPPSLATSQSNNGSYKAMPPGWYYGTWHVTHSSQPGYWGYRNLQYNPSPFFPQSSLLPGQDNDLSSFQIGNSSVITTAYGVDTPRRSNDKSLGPEWDDVTDFVGTGNLATMANSIEYISWGYDTLGVPYTVNHETAMPQFDFPTDINVASASDKGPSNATLTEIYNALLALDNAEITRLVQEIRPLVHDGARRGLGPVVCDTSCVNNVGMTI